MYEAVGTQTIGWIEWYRIDRELVEQIFDLRRTAARATPYDAWARNSASHALGADCRRRPKPTFGRPTLV